MKKQNTIFSALMVLLFSVSFTVSAQDNAYYNNLAKKEYENKNYYNAIDYEIGRAHV